MWELYEQAYQAVQRCMEREPNEQAAAELDSMMSRLFRLQDKWSDRTIND